MKILIIQSVLAAIICLVAAVFDKKTGKIPNTLTFSGVLLGCIISFFNNTSQLLLSLVIIVGLFFFGMTGAIGMGDLKLLMAVVAIGGWKMFIVTFLSSFLLFLFCAGLFEPQRTWLYLTNLKSRLQGKKIPVDKKKKFYFAPFVFIGNMFYFLFFTEFSPLLFLINLFQK